MTIIPILRPFSGWASMASFSANVQPFVLALQILLASTVVLLFLGEKSIWLDEGISIVVVAGLDWSTMWQALVDQYANMGLYYVLLHFWLKIGESETLVRSLSGIFAVGTVPIVYALGNRLFGPRVATIAGFLIPLNAFFVQYAQEARGYSLFLFLASLSSYFLVRVMERPSWRICAGFVLSSVLVVYAHFFGVLLLVAQGLSLALIDRRYIPWRAFLLSGATIFLLLIPLGMFVITKQGNELGWVSQPNPRDLFDLFETLSGGAGIPLLLAYFATSLLALFFALRTWLRLKMSLETWRYGLLLSWLFIPVIIAFSFSFIKPIFVERYFIFCLPPLVLLTAVGLSHIRPKWIMAGALATLVLLSGQSVADWYIVKQKSDWRGATSHVITHFEETDSVLWTPFLRGPFEYYLDRLSAPGEVLAALDSSEESEIKAVLYTIPAASYSADSGLPNILQEPLDSLADRHPRVWLILSHDRPPRRRLLQASLQSKYGLIEERRFKGLTVLLYELNGSTTER